MDRKARRNPKLAVAEAAQLRAYGRLEEAEAALRRALARDPRMVEALHLLGLVLHERGASLEAVDLLSKAAAGAPHDGDVLRNLGLVAAEAGDDARAEPAFRKALSVKPGDAASRGNLALLLERTGREAEAIVELEELARRSPKDAGALELLAKLLRRTRQHEREVAVAKALLALRPGDAGVMKALSRSYFLWFDAVDREPEKAREVLAAWLAHDADDPVAQHMHAALRAGASEAPARASDAYVERHFDEFAESFDEVLQGLDYRGPALVHEALAATGESASGAWHILDLGCGTGALGPLAKPYARRLAGVDLSGKMLDAARSRRLYDQLERAEATAFLAKKPRAFDTILCADTLPYLGDLRPLFAVVATSLTRGGRFFATAELNEAKADGLGYVLHPSGRYAHAPSYLEAELARAGLSIERNVRAELRKERGAPVLAAVVTARAPG